jgi:C-terminal processing protease CtpA/Prc
LIAVLQDRSIAGQIHGNRPGTTIELAPEGTSRDYVPIANRAFFGLNVGNLSDAFRRQFAIPTYRGAAVTGVVAESPAASAGLKPGDCIVDMDGVSVQSPEMVYDIVKQCKPGQVISVSYYRGGQLTTASVPLAIDDSLPPSKANDRSFPSEMLTPEYVESLQFELNRVNEELALTQERLQNLEARLQQIEKKR